MSEKNKLSNEKQRNKNSMFCELYSSNRWWSSANSTLVIYQSQINSSVIKRANKMQILDCTQMLKQVMYYKYLGNNFSNYSDT